MLLVLLLIALLTLLELLLGVVAGRWLKVGLAAVIIFGLSLSSSWLVLMRVNGWLVLFAVLSAYRVFNMLRLVAARSQADYLQQSFRQASWRLIGSQVLTLIGLAATTVWQLAPHRGWQAVGVAQLIATGLLLFTTQRNIRHTRPPQLEQTYADRDLPSVTVAIPARNETEALAACLQSLVASTYPKLEILVLDDCSQNKHTPEIIRSFAHDGVRFMAGKVPPEQWLAKNYAYQQLAKVANGEVLLFCGVDVRFEPDSIGILVETLLQKKKTMLSVLPHNTSPPGTKLQPSIIQPNRYAWELAVPAGLRRQPAFLSTCWLIERSMLVQAGGFAAVSRAILPERYFARYAARHADGYSFMQSSPAMGVRSEKSLPDQRDTAIRTRYPQLHRRPNVVAWVSLAELGILVLPYGELIAAWLYGNWLLAVSAGLSCVLLSLQYYLIMRLTYRRSLLRALWLLPLAALYDVGLLNYSMQQYEFGEVVWKGRNVCIPVMRVIPHLPSA